MTVTKKILQTKSVAVVMILFTAFLFLVGNAFHYFADEETKTVIRNAEISVDGKAVSDSLPFSQGNLLHRSEVAISFYTPAQKGNFLFFGSVYAPLQIYANDKLIYEYGSEDT